jgi:hypothetical protein
MRNSRKGSFGEIGKPSAAKARVNTVYPGTASKAGEKALHLAEKPGKSTALAETSADSMALTVRLKFCPDASAGPREVFPQPQKPRHLGGRLRHPSTALGAGS